MKSAKRMGDMRHERHASFLLALPRFWQVRRRMPSLHARRHYATWLAMPGRRVVMPFYRAMILAMPPFHHRTPVRCTFSAHWRHRARPAGHHRRAASRWVLYSTTLPRFSNYLVPSELLSLKKAPPRCIPFSHIARRFLARAAMHHFQATGCTRRHRHTCNRHGRNNTIIAADYRWAADLVRLPYQLTSRDDASRLISALPPHTHSVLRHHRPRHTTRATNSHFHDVNKVSLGLRGIFNHLKCVEAIALPGATWARVPPIIQYPRGAERCRFVTLSSRRGTLHAFSSYYSREFPAISGRHRHLYLLTSASHENTRLNAKFPSYYLGHYSTNVMHAL